MFHLFPSSTSLEFAFQPCTSPLSSLPSLGSPDSSPLREPLPLVLLPFPARADSDSFPPRSFLRVSLRATLAPDPSRPNALVSKSRYPFFRRSLLTRSHDIQAATFRVFARGQWLAETAECISRSDAFFWTSVPRSNPPSPLASPRAASVVLLRSTTFSADSSSRRLPLATSPPELRSVFSPAPPSESPSAPPPSLPLPPPLPRPVSCSATK